MSGWVGGRMGLDCNTKRFFSCGGRPLLRSGIESRFAPVQFGDQVNE